MAEFNPNDLSTLGIDIDEPDHDHDFSVYWDDGMCYCSICGCSYDEK